MNENKFNRRRVRSSYVISVVSLSLVLLLLGMAGLLLINARKLSDETRESFVVSVFFRDSVSEAQAQAFKAKIELLEYVKSSAYISRETAAEGFKKELGEDFEDFLGFNPLPATLDVTFNKEYVSEEVFRSIENEWKRDPRVEKVGYNPEVAYIMKTARTTGWYLLVFCSLLAVIAIALINNTIRLTIYSKRLLIRTMKLVGATRGFIRRPFIRSGLLQGFLAGLLALCMLAGVLLVLERQIPELRQMRDWEWLSVLAGGLLLAGILLSLICTFFAVRRYLNLKADSLY